MIQACKTRAELITGASPPPARQSLRETIYKLMWFPLKRIKPDDYKYKDTFDKAIEVLNTLTKSPISTWPAFYGVGSRLILQSGKRTMLVTYQNKYTFQRTLSFVFSIYWKACALLYFYVLYLGHKDSVNSNLQKGCAGWVMQASVLTQEAFLHIFDIEVSLGPS